MMDRKHWNRCEKLCTLKLSADICITSPAWNEHRGEIRMAPFFFRLFGAICAMFPQLGEPKNMFQSGPVLVANGVITVSYNHYELWMAYKWPMNGGLITLRWNNPTYHWFLGSTFYTSIYFLVFFLLKHRNTSQNRSHSSHGSHCWAEKIVGLWGFSWRELSNWRLFFFETWEETLRSVVSCNLIL